MGTPADLATLKVILMRLANIASASAGFILDSPDANLSTIVAKTLASPAASPLGSSLVKYCSRRCAASASFMACSVFS
jgi:hypothetical protein